MADWPLTSTYDFIPYLQEEFTIVPTDVLLKQAGISILSLTTTLMTKYFIDYLYLTYSSVLKFNYKSNV